MHIYNDDTECIEIWDKIIELIGINNNIYFLKADDHDYLLWQMYPKIQPLLLKIIIDIDIIKL